jgi:cytochrome c oxidase subunit III
MYVAEGIENCKLQIANFKLKTDTMANVTIAAAEHPHPRNLAHHFDSPEQQFAAGKLGIWLFLTTEILLFSGLFCAYAVYRSNHPEIFEYAHLYLSKPLGATNTLVLIFSSFTMATAVWAAQTGHQKALVRLLSVTLVCGFVFMGIKFAEYKDKWEEGLLTGSWYKPAAAPEKADVPEFRPAIATPAPSGAAGVPQPSEPLTGAMQLERSKILPAPVGPPGISERWLARGHGGDNKWAGPEPYNVQIFFALYFAMTGLHGIHVLGGMAVIGWILVRARRGDFGPDYFNPVDFTGLYWHLVDLVWIFLFPLFYLIT